jgi:undecaprenyl diphosphate synthase
MTRGPALSQAYLLCRDYAQSNTNGYGIGTHWLPPTKQSYCDALLAFVMHTDELADDTTVALELRAARFMEWRETFEAVRDGRTGSDDLEGQLCRAFVDTMSTWGLSSQSVEVYLDAQALELTFSHFATFRDLRAHADDLIGTTCAWANAIYGGVSKESERRSRHLGIASQVSDYLVDLQTDLAQGRLYLPMEDLDRFGVDRRTLEAAALDGITPQNVRELVLFESARALKFCDSGSGWDLLVASSARDAAWLPEAVYRHQLEHIERSEGDIFGLPPMKVEELAERMRSELAPSDPGAVGTRPIDFGGLHQGPGAPQNRADLPVHLGIILDGNRRWARKHGVPVAFAHRRGEAVFRDLSVRLLARGIKYLSVYLFSTENWNRDPHEVGDLMDLLTEVASDMVDTLTENRIRLRFLGKPDGLPYRLRSAISRAEDLTAGSDGGTLAICVNYGGLTEIADACRGMISAGVLPQDISPKTVADHLYAPDIPPVDLVVRTGGDHRLSNFMLWRSAYAEMEFLPALWPDIEMGDIERALESYALRSRRFGS